MESNRTVTLNVPEYELDVGLDYWEEDYTEWLDEDNLRSFSTVCYSLFFCISLAGNSFLLWVLLKREGLRRTSNLLLLHLTVSDLIFTLPLPIWAANTNQSLVMSDMACRFLNGVWSLGLYNYMIFLMAITVHRYNAVIHAHTRSIFKPFVHRVCIVLWLLCLLCSAPELVILETSDVISRPINDTENQYVNETNYFEHQHVGEINNYEFQYDTENQYVNSDKDNENQYCIHSYESNHLSYLRNYMQIIIFFFLPFGVIVFCYLRMCLRIRKSRMARKNQTMRLIFLIVVGFFICWAPYNIFLSLLLLSFHGLIPQGAFMSTIAFQVHYTIANLLISLHCGLSPLVHIFGAQKFREHLPLNRSFRRLFGREKAFSVKPQVVVTTDTGQTSGQKNVQ